MSAFPGQERPRLTLELARRKHLGPFWIAAIYCAVALAWIALSDLVLDVFIDDAGTISRVQTAKGVAFVLVTAALLYALVRRDAHILSNAEQELAAADAEVDQLAAFPRLNPNPLLVVGPAGDVRYRNASAIGAAARAGVNVEELLPDDIGALIAESMGSGEAVRPGVLQSGTRHFDWTLFQHPPSGLVYAFATDRTEEVTLAVRAIQGERFESLGRLAAGVAHDFNNVLVAIGRMTTLLEDCVGDDEQAQRLMAQLQLATAHGTEMVEQLRRFGQPAAAPAILDINEEIARAEHLLHQATGASVRIALDLRQGELPARISPGSLMQILMNLVQNAADASAPGSEIRLSTAVKEPERAVVMVADRGTGMTEEVRRKAFQPFFTTKHPEGGTGLGLMSVESTVQAAGGVVQLESAPGEGTTVTIELPLAAQERAAG